MKSSFSKLKRSFSKMNSNFILLISIMLFFSACNKQSKPSDKVLFGKEDSSKETVAMHRFDKALFSYENNSGKSLEEYLFSLEKEYKAMFATELSNQEYMSIIKAFTQDEQMQEANKAVMKAYPDLKWLESDLAEALSKIKKIRSNNYKNDIYTLMLGPAEYSFAYQNRILVYPEFSAISLDLYTINSLSAHPYYKTIPEYMRKCLTKDNIAPDFVRTYLQEITFRDIPLQSQNPEATLLDCIVDNGKYSYAVSALLPQYKLNHILRYTEQEQEWVEANEYNIWTYIVQNQLLYCKDRTKYLSLTAEGPSTKGIADSPARIGNFIGFKIVEAYMNQNSITIDSLFKISNSKLILNESKYKPIKK